MIDYSRKLLLVLGLLLMAGAIQANDKLSISRAYSPEAPPVVKVLAAYALIENKSANDITIISIRSPDFNKVEIHRIEAKDGMMSMVKQEQLTIPAGKVISLQPGEIHIMLIGPRRIFRDGDTLQLNLELDNGQQQTVTVPVRKHNVDNSFF